MTERTFDWIPSKDVRNRNFIARAALEETLAPRGYTWNCPVLLDQGPDGACVGFGWAHELAARPSKVTGVTNETGFRIYHRAQKLDEWEGENYEGTSVLAGAKVAVSTGFVNEYRWIYTVEDLAMVIGHHGPVVVGMPWRYDMMDINGAGYIRYSGPEVGGHCILFNGYGLTKRRFRVHQSWGPWGINNTGEAFISEYDMRLAFNEGAEGCVPMRRDLVGVLP